MFGLDKIFGGGDKPKRPRAPKETGPSIFDESLALAQRGLALQVEALAEAQSEPPQTPWWVWAILALGVAGVVWILVKR